MFFICSLLLSSFWLFNLSTLSTAQAAPTAISGTVYRDYNASGSQDALEPGIEGIIVTAYGDNNVNLGTGLTNSTGAYSLSVAASAAGYRLEFTPNADQASWLNAGPAQATSGNTHVVFVADGETNVDVSFQGLSDYCGSDADIATTCYVFGDHDAPILPDAIVSVDYLLTGNYVSSNFTQEAGIATVGSVYGLAYQSSNDTLFSSAHLKRHSDFGDFGPGAVYMTDYSAGSNALLFVDLNNVALPDGTQLPATTAGADFRDESSIPGNYTYSQDFGNGLETVTVSSFWFHDPDAYAKIGKMSLGDIDISDDDSTLYIVNMKDRKLYIVDATATAPVTQLAAAPIAIPNNCANAADARPMALKYNDGALYVGVTCSAESSQSASDLSASVFAFDPVALSFDTTPVVSVPLNYDRGCIFRTDLNVAVPPDDCLDTPNYLHAGDQSNTANWRPWQPDWSVAYSRNNNSGFNHFNIEYPQPLLADIEFDNGNMILGFRDVNGDRSGDCAGVPDSSITPQTDCNYDSTYGDTAGDPAYGQGIYRGNGMGDMLRACGDAGSGWTLEANGSCGGVTNAAGVGNLQGPGNGEFYWQDQGPTGPGGVDFGGYFGGHDQSVMGSLAQIPGQADVAVTMMDPRGFYDGGLAYFDNSNGQTDGRRLQVYATTNTSNIFGKANGLGDLEPICAAAPIEVGNRVWADANGNGVQDPSESGIGGVQVTLTCDGGTAVSATTSADGSYLFSSIARSGATTAPDLVPGASCTIDAPTTVNSEPVTNGAMALNDMHDSDADTSGDIDFVAGAAGENNHTFDIGYGATTTPVAGDAAIGNYVWLDENSDGVQDAGEPGIPNVVVMLVRDDNGDTFQTVTDANGGYLFPNLFATAGTGTTYTVMIKDINFAAGGALEDYFQTPLTPGGTGGAAYNADFGNKDGDGYSILLNVGDENLSADFGYNANTNPEVNNNIGNAAVGDRVWIDLDGDGVQDPSEVGVEGVGLTLYGPGPDGLFGTPDDEALETTETDANGNYLFDDLEPGAYTICVSGSATAAANVLDAAQYAQTGDPDHFGRDASALGSDPMGLAGDSCSTVPVVLAPGDVFLNVDFGYQPEASTPVGSIGNTVWLDADADGNGPADVNGDGGNGDGTEDDNDEEPIANVTVALIKDLNGDGVFDAGEPVVATDTTDENGQYFFGGLPLEACGSGAGVDKDYLVWVNDSNSVLGMLSGTYDSDGNSGGGSVLNAPGVYGLSAVTINCTDTDDIDQDFGYTPRGHSEGFGLVGDYVWFDIDSDGVQDVDELGIEGVVVELLDAGGTSIASPVETNENGYYAFGNLPLGVAYMTRVAASNFAAGGVLEGMTQTFDNDAPTNDNKSTSATLTAGSPVDLSLDFGYVGSTGRLGNLVWLDLNANGTYAAAEAETSIANVTLDLYRDLDCDGLVGTDDVLFSSTTTVSAIVDVQFGADGTYDFKNLPIVGAGSNSGACYVVDVTDANNELVGYWHSLGTVGISNESQPDPYGNNGSLELSAATPENLTADFGYYVDPACLGNHVFVDGNSDNVQGNAADAGLGGVELTLDITYANDAVSLMTVSEGDGFYQFCNLLLDEDYNDVDDASGADGVVEPTFTISADTPAGYTPVTSNVGDDQLDGDDPTGVAALPTQGATDVTAQDPATDESDPIASYDFGYTGTSSAPVDFGDAPDSYGTTLAEDGARHSITNTGNPLRMGACIDAEGNGSPDAYAGTIGSGGDDNTSGTAYPTASCNDGDNDEDGVTATPASWTEGTDGGSANINASADGCLNAWIDFNNDGQFLGAAEHVIVNALVSAGANSNDFDVPTGGTDAPTFARYRLSPRDSGLCTETVEPTGLVAGGEVEDYYLDFGEELDFGDLPDTNGPGGQVAYGGTRAGDDGASHVLNGLFLGASVDAETDGQPTAAANGDDNDGSDDEDGIVVPTKAGGVVDWNDGINAGSLDATANADGCLNAWVDWNVDGQFDGAGEHVVINGAVTSGSSAFTFDIPTLGTSTSINGGVRFARYRLTPRDAAGSCSENVAPTGRVDGGEVEDYRYILAGSTAVTLRGVDTAVSSQVAGTAAVLMLSLVTAGVMLRRRDEF